MILVKLLIWLLLILIWFYAYDHMGSLASFFDGRQGFQSREGFSQVEADTTDDDDDAIEFKEEIPLDQHKNLANDTAMINAVQEQMNELLKLNDQAIDINNSLYK
jgi:hypothetical protein